MNKIVIFFLLTISLQISAQQTEWNSSRILLEIEKLNTTGSVLYIAAHPDDENTRLITYLANDKKVRTGYLSLTRGDGGQNLVGEEQGAYLGVIRTQELMAARRTDGGEQFFTRAVDFGYSKSADETFSKWPHDSLLADVVWVIRNFRPDIIITRFPADERAGHGQHTVSAMIAEEAFAAAADPTKFPEQLKYVSVWQTQRLFWNNSTWWDKELPNKIANGDKNLVSFDVGGYNALLGKSYGEIAADSRTNHKSQGFGATPTRGEQKEYLELKKGNAVISNTDLLADINTTWERYRQGSEIKIVLEKIIADYDISHPEKSVDALLTIYNMLDKMPADKFIDFKKQQCQNIIAACLGLWLEPVAEKQSYGAYEKIKLVSTALKRTDYPIVLESIQYFDKPSNSFITDKVGEILPPGINQIDTLITYFPYNVYYSPYWLSEKFPDQQTSLFTVKSLQQRLLPENKPAATITYTIKIGDRSFKFEKAVVYKETDAVKGEIYRPLQILTSETAETSTPLIFVKSGNIPEVILHIKALTDNYSRKIYLLNDTSRIKTDPPFIEVNLGENESVELKFKILETVSGAMILTPAFYRVDTLTILDEETYTEKQLTVSSAIPVLKSVTIHYDHIPDQFIMEDLKIKLVNINCAKPALKIAYIEGAGDKVDESLKQFGLNITTIKPEQITAEELKKYDAVVIGVRAYNVSKTLADNQQIVLNYVNEGGLVITQYSTNWDSYAEQLGPYPFKITRNRVTDENSPVEFLLADHPVLNYPNKITKEDFNGWIQERGIYFTTDMSPEYKMPLAFTDPNEQPQSGSLIIADYGKGAFMYTGIVFFRELPAGVPGAYRLFVNMLSYKQGGK